MRHICPICSASLQSAFGARLLGKHDVTYLVCTDCGLLQTEEPYWLDEAYSDAISVTDTGLVSRNCFLANKLTALLQLQYPNKACFLDVAGGLGMLTRLMRDRGFDYYWSDKYCTNALARGFEAEKAPGPFVAMTAFEVLEHVHRPLEFVRENMELHGCKTLIFSTELYPDEGVPDLDWWYYAFHSGQHITFYQKKTLQKMADHLGLSFYTFDGMHVLTDQLIKWPRLTSMISGRIAPLISFIVSKKRPSLTVRDHEHLRRSA